MSMYTVVSSEWWRCYWNTDKAQCLYHAFLYPNMNNTDILCHEKITSIIITLVSWALFLSYVLDELVITYCVRTVHHLNVLTGFHLLSHLLLLFNYIGDVEWRVCRWRDRCGANDGCPTTPRWTRRTSVLQPCPICQTQWTWNGFSRRITG